MRCGWMIPAMIGAMRLALVVHGALMIMIAILFSTACQAQPVPPKRPTIPGLQEQPKGRPSNPNQAKGHKPDAKRQLRENVTLPVDSNLEKRFFTIKDLLEDRRWAEAIVVLQEMAQTESKSLVKLPPGKVGEVVSYLNVATRCNVLLSSIPAEGRAEYRQKVDPQAKRWFENWLRTRDESELLRIVRQSFLSSYADEAMLALGEAAWDRSDFSSAQSWWEQLLPLPNDVNSADYPMILRYPDTNLDHPAILARIILCSIMHRELDRAEDELLQFAERFPDAEGRIAGENGRYVDILRKTLAESRSWKPNLYSAEVATFGLSFERYQKIPENVDVGALRWTRSLTPAVLPKQNGRLPFQNDYLSYHPVVYDNRHEKIAIVNDADSIRAWNVLTGEPAWKSENPDSAVIYPAFLEEPTTFVERSVGVPHYTMTIAEDRLYARMGSPITRSSNLEVRRETPSDLVCLDLKKEGKLIWKVGAHELFPRTWRFEGTPVVFGGRAYVAVCLHRPQLELIIACLDADDGRLLWQRPIGAFRASADESVNRISHLLLTAGGGRLYLSTDLGAIVALDALDGRLDWALSYESRVDGSAQAPGESSRISLTPALYHDGLLFVAPSDANSAYCVEADSGRVRWQYPYMRSPRPEDRQQVIGDRQWRHLLGVVPGGVAGRLIVSGNSVWAVDIESGQLAWSPGDGALKRRAKGPFGRGLITGNQILIPMRETIEIFNLQSGELARSVPLKTLDTPQQGGNLTFAGGMLLVAQPNRLAAYGEYSQLKERIEYDLTSYPEESATRIRLAELETSERQFENAITLYHEILKQLDPNDPSYAAAKHKLSKQLRELASNEFRAGNMERAIELWHETIRLADDIVRQSELILQLSREAEAFNEPEIAIGELQRILSNEHLSKARFEKSTAGKIASKLITCLISERGRDVYRNIESVAAAEFAEVKERADRSQLDDLIARYPHSQAAIDAKQILLHLHKDAGQLPEAYTVLDDIRENAVDERSLVEASLSMLELFRRAGYTNSMKPLWRSLADTKLNSSVDYAGVKQDLKPLVSAQLNELEPKLKTRPRRLERTWSLEQPIKGRVIIPKGEAVAASLNSVIVCVPSESPPDAWQWRCVDCQSGNVRWNVTSSEPVEIAQWTPIHLLFGTKHGWQARTVEDGRKVWEQQSPTPIRPQLFEVRTSSSSSSSIETSWPTICDSTEGLRIFDPIKGNQVAKLKPPGNLVNTVGFGKLTISADRIGASQKFLHQRAEPEKREGMICLHAVIIQTIKPTQNWIATAISPRDEWLLEEFAEGSEPWRTPPSIRENWLTAITTDQCLKGYPLEELHYGDDDPSESGDLQQSINFWSYRNFASAHATPAIIDGSKDILIVVDGTQLASFDSSTGSRKWMAGLVDLPMKHPAAQVAVNRSTAFATAQGILRAISIEDGSIRFERYLGSIEEQWKTSVVWEDSSDVAALEKSTCETNSPSSLVAAWSMKPIKNQRYAINLCDGLSGAVLQQLHVDGTPQGIEIDSTGQGIVWTEQAVIGLRFTQIPRSAEVGVKSHE